MAFSPAQLRWRFWMIPPAGFLLMPSYFIAGAAQSRLRRAYRARASAYSAAASWLWILSVLLLGGSFHFWGINCIATIIEAASPGLKMMATAPCTVAPPPASPPGRLRAPVFLVSLRHTGC